MRPERPWLSVAMPIHNGERWLGETLDSVAVQGRAGVELLIWDSSETDACGEIVKRYANDLDITYAYVPKVKPWTAKTNLAVVNARAPHVSILHQDDLWLPGRTEAVRSAIRQFGDAALLLNPSFIVDEESRPKGLWRCPLPSSRPLSTEQVARKLLVQNFVSMPAPVIRRSAWNEVGGMDEALWYTADWDLYLKLAGRGATVYLNQPTTAFRIHGKSLTVSGSRNPKDFRDQMRRVLDRHLALLPAAERAKVRRRALASIAVNCALAAPERGGVASALSAARSVMGLGPSDAVRYLNASRIVERALPRLRARFAGSF